jgi:hypothetical protein
MKILLTIFLFCVSANLFCQVKPVNFKECKYEMFFVTAETQPQWKDSLSLIKYFNQYFEKHLINLNKDVNGKIVLGIIIYEDGHTCCESFFDLTKNKLNSEQFKNAVNEMPKWLPAKQHDKEIIFLKNQIIEIKEGVFSNN